MSTIATPYYHVECTGPGPTLLHKTCPAISDGGWDKEEVEASAAKEGWKIGRNSLCPKHNAPEPTAPKPIRQKAAPKVENHDDHQG